MTSDERRLRDLLLTYCLKEGDEYTLSSGVRSSRYIDCRPILLTAEGARLAAQVVMGYLPRAAEDILLEPYRKPIVTTWSTYEMLRRSMGQRKY